MSIEVPSQSQPRQGEQERGWVIGHHHRCESHGRNIITSFNVYINRCIMWLVNCLKAPQNFAEESWPHNNQFAGELLNSLELVITGFTGIDISIKTYSGNSISHDQQQTQGKSLAAEIFGRTEVIQQRGSRANKQFCDSCRTVVCIALNMLLWLT